MGGVALLPSRFSRMLHAWIAYVELCFAASITDTCLLLIKWNARDSRFPDIEYVS